MEWGDLDTDRLLALTMAVIAAYMFYAASEYQGNAVTFPRLTASVVIIGAGMVLFQDYLPDVIRKSVADASAIIEIDQEEDVAAATEATEDEHFRFRTRLTFVLLIAFVIGSYLIGFLYASPLFVATYTAIMRQKWYIVLITSVLAFAFAYAFMHALNIPVDEGLFVEGWRAR